MRVLLLLALLPLSACGPDFWNQPAQPAPTGITPYSHGLDSTTGGGEPSISPRGSRMTIGGGGVIR